MLYPVKLCLNGHEWVKQQLRRQRIRFESLDNGFLTCAEPVGPAGHLRCPGRRRRPGVLRWLVASPALADDGGRPRGRVRPSPRHLPTRSEPHAGLRPPRPGPALLRSGHSRESRPRPARPGRAPLPAPPHPQATPPPAYGYRTRVITDGVEPSLHVEYEASHVKQFFKEQHALRTETTINNPKDFYVTKGVDKLGASARPRGRRQSQAPRGRAAQPRTACSPRTPSTACSSRPSRPDNGSRRSASATRG